MAKLKSKVGNTTYSWTSDDIRDAQLNNKANREWIEHSSYDIEYQGNTTVTDLDQYSEVMIKYGRKNYTQAFGGSCIILPFDENCVNYVPLYTDGGFQGTLYIFARSNHTLILQNETYQGTAKFRVYVR